MQQDLRALCASLGFVKMGVARAGVLEEERKHLRNWLASGYAGEMAWMANTEAQRIDPLHEGVAPFAKSVIAVAIPYGGNEAHGPHPTKVSRYAQGRDYHRVVGRRLLRVVRFLEACGHRARPAVDSKPVFERAWAVRAGLGFVGKNACLIVPGIGSFVFLGFVLTDAALVPDSQVPSGCGTCTRCLDACPTRAFVAPRQLDARRCVSYLTIEHRGPVPDHLREGLQGWVFGCDVCQDVCPYNHGKGAAHVDSALAARGRSLAVSSVTPEAALATPDERGAPEHAGTTAPADSHAFSALDAEAILRMDEPTWARFSEGSAMRRAGLAQLQRNVALALGNVGERRHLPVLQSIAQTRKDEQVGEASRWALDTMKARGIG